MKIECILKRRTVDPKTGVVTNGSDIELGAVMYEFRPLDPKDTKSPHVCEVTNKAHIERLLSIRDGYRIHGVLDSAPDAAPAVPAAAPQVGTRKDPEDIESLRARVETKLGRKVSPKAGREKLEAMLSAA